MAAARLHWAEDPPSSSGPSAWIIGTRPLLTARGVPDDVTLLVPNKPAGFDLTGHHLHLLD